MQEMHYFGELGLETGSNYSTDPVKVDNNSWNKVSLKYRHTCGLRADNTVWCWGYNDGYRLGDPNVTAEYVFTPVKVINSEVPGSVWLDLSVGHLHTCAKLNDGSLWCWGSDGGGKLGADYSGPILCATPVEVVDEVPAVSWTSFTSGEENTCALKEDYSLWCWGGNELGECAQDLEDGTKFEHPVEVIY